MAIEKERSSICSKIIAQGPAAWRCTRETETEIREGPGLPTAARCLHRTHRGVIPTHANKSSYNRTQGVRASMLLSREELCVRSPRLCYAALHVKHHANNLGRVSISTVKSPWCTSELKSRRDNLIIKSRVLILSELLNYGNKNFTQRCRNSWILQSLLKLIATLNVRFNLFEYFDLFFKILYFVDMKKVLTGIKFIKMIVFLCLMWNLWRYRSNNFFVWVESWKKSKREIHDHRELRNSHGWVLQAEII